MKHLLLFVFLCAALGAQAQVYKWVDKDGKTQYSDQPPPPGAAKSEAQKVTSVGTSAPSSGVATPPKAPERGKDAEKGKQDAGEKLKKDEDAAKQAQQMQEACASAKNALRTLQDGGRITTIGADGERTLMDDAQIEKELVKAQKSVADTCK